MDIIRIIIYLSIFIGLFTTVFYLLGFLESKKRLNKKVNFLNVSIIIPAYNEEKTLEKTVESAANLNYPKDKFEIIIVNDGSKDHTEEIAKKLEIKYKNVKAYTKKNGGKGSALNYGIKKSIGEIIISLDADSFVTKNALQYMMPYFSDKEIMCVTPALKVINPKGILQRLQAIEYDLGIFLRKAFSKINAVHITPGPFSAYRKVFFEKYGGYDENNITEDMEIGMRIQSLNYRIENSPMSLVYTTSPNKFLALTKQRRRWYFGMLKNLWAYRKMFSKNYGELGIFVLPLALFSILTMIIITSYYIWKIIADAIQNIHLFSLTGYDIYNSLEIKGYLLSLSFYRMLSENLVIFGFFFSLFSIILLIYVNKKVSSLDRPISTFLNYICFIFLYSFLFSFWWVISFIYYMTKKEINWR